MTTIRAPFASRRRQDRRPSPTTAHDMRPNDSLAVVIVAKNEAARIADCIASAAFADEVLVLDSGSTDRTATIARGGGSARRRHRLAGLRPAGGARLFARAERLGAVARRRRAHPGRSCKPRSAPRSRRGAHDGYRIPRWSEFCGKVMHHGGWRPDRTLAARPARQVGIHGRFPACSHDGRRPGRRPRREPDPPQLPRRARRPREARPLLERQRPRHAFARPERGPGEGDRARRCSRSCARIC